MFGHFMTLYNSTMIKTGIKSGPEITFQDTEWPFIVEGSDGLLYFRKDIPRFLIYPEDPGSQILIRGKPVTVIEFKAALKSIM